MEPLPPKDPFSFDPTLRDRVVGWLDDKRELNSPLIVPALGARIDRYVEKKFAGVSHTTVRGMNLLRRVDGEVEDYTSGQMVSPDQLLARARHDIAAARHKALVRYRDSKGEAMTDRAKTTTSEVQLSWWNQLEGQAVASLRTAHNRDPDTGRKPSYEMRHPEATAVADEFDKVRESASKESLTSLIDYVRCTWHRGMVLTFPGGAERRRDKAGLIRDHIHHHELKIMDKEAISHKIAVKTGLAKLGFNIAFLVYTMFPPDEEN
jgi:hypothetical protein